MLLFDIQFYLWLLWKMEFVIPEDFGNNGGSWTPVDSIQLF